MSDNANILVERDGLLVDPETGEVFDSLPVVGGDRITDAEAAAILRRIADADADTKIAADKLAGAQERLTRNLAVARGRSEWLRKQAAPVLTAWLRSKLRGKARSVAVEEARVGLRATRGSLKVRDHAGALDWAKTHAPAAVTTRTEERLSVELLHLFVDPASTPLPANLFEISPPRDVLYVDTIDGVKVPGVPVGAEPAALATGAAQ